MKPILAMPMFDPKGNLFPHLKKITVQLKGLFKTAVISISPSMQEAQKEYVHWCKGDPFFHIVYLPDQLPVGKEFAILYQRAAERASPDQGIHLAYIDRVAFALQSDYAAQFQSDIRELKAESLPLCFERSPTAWETHPQNYHALEGMATKAGELLFGKRLDFGWCHLVVQGKELRRIMPHVHSSGIDMVAEMMLLLKNDIQNKEVDWLAWEDPFIEGTDAAELKAEREKSRDETQKRLSYVVSALQMISDAANSERRIQCPTV
ncbi:MAG: hypothetical protein AAF702_40100 [Chloroflexota bacterium]